MGLLQHEYVTDEEKQKAAYAAELANVCDDFVIEYCPRAIICTDGDTQGDLASEGHAYDLSSIACGNFPAFGFEVCLDGRSNNGDLAQTVVDELFAIVEGYRKLATRVAERLQRSPQPSPSQWESDPERDRQERKELEEFSRTIDRMDTTQGENVA